MKSSLTGASAAQSKTAFWRRWTPFSLPIMARAAVVRSAGCKDVDGHPLPPIPELPDIMTIIHCYHSCRRPIKGMDETIRHRLPAQFAAEMSATVASLRQRGLDLAWRLVWEEYSNREHELVVALGVMRMKPHKTRGPVPNKRRV